MPLPPVETRVSADVSGFIAGIGAATASARGFEKATIGMTGALTGLSAATALVSTKLAIDFDREITKVETLVGVAREQVDAWRQDLLGLTDTGRGPRELARAMFVVTSAGERGANALRIVEGAAKASAVGLGDTAVVARAVTAAVQAFAEQGLTAERALDVMLATVREGNLDAASLAGSLGRVLGIAAQMGVTFDELGTFIATFTRLGVSAEEAVTALRGTLAVTLKPTKETQEALESVGLSADQLRRNISEKGLTQALIDLVTASRGNVETLGKLIPNIRALSGVLGTAGAQGETFREIADSIRSSAGELDRAFERVRDTPAQSLEELKAKAEAAAIGLGQLLVPAADFAIDRLLDAASAAQGLVDVMDDLPEPLRNAAVAAGGLATALGAVATAAGVAAAASATAAGARGIGAMLTVLRVGGPLVLGLSAVVAFISLMGREVREALGPIRDLSGDLDETADAADRARIGLEGMTQAQLQRQLTQTDSTINSLVQRIYVYTEALRQAKEMGTAQNPFTGQQESAEVLRAKLDQLQAKLTEVRGVSDEITAAMDRFAESLSTVGDRTAKETEIGKLNDKLRETIIELTAGEEALFRFQLAAMEGTDSERALALELHRSAVNAERLRRETEGLGEARAFLARIAEQQAQQEAEALRRVREVEENTDLAQMIAQAQSLQQAWDRVSAAVTDTALDLITLNNQVGESFKDLADTVIRELGRIAATRVLDPLFRQLERLLIVIPSAPGAIPEPSPPVVPALARGGSIGAGQVALVGEAGPELVRGPASVTPLNGAPVQLYQTVNFHVSTIDGRSTAEFMRQNRHTIAGAVAQAAREGSAVRSTLLRG